MCIFYVSFASLGFRFGTAGLDYKTKFLHLK